MQEHVTMLSFFMFFQVKCLTTSWLMAEWRKRRPGPSSDRSATPRTWRQLCLSCSITYLRLLQYCCVVMVLFYPAYLLCTLLRRLVQDRQPALLWIHSHSVLYLICLIHFSPQIVSAVHYCHQKNIVHRDLKVKLKCIIVTVFKF